MRSIKSLCWVSTAAFAMASSGFANTSTAPGQIAKRVSERLSAEIIIADGLCQTWYASDPARLDACIGQNHDALANTLSQYTVSKITSFPKERRVDTIVVSESLSTIAQMLPQPPVLDRVLPYTVTEGLSTSDEVATFTLKPGEFFTLTGVTDVNGNPPPTLVTHAIFDHLPQGTIDAARCVDIGGARVILFLQTHDGNGGLKSATGVFSDSTEGHLGSFYFGLCPKEVRISE